MGSQQLIAMTEKAESSKVLANVLRTTPYTAYTATFAIGCVFPASECMWLFIALICNELLNHGLKALCKKLPIPKEITARPTGAIDCGIYPQHNPTVSLSSGMPSGHSQTACFLAAVLLQHSKGELRAMVFVLGYTGLVLLSRTKHGGPLVSISVNGQIPGCHTVPQVLWGAVIGSVLGWYAYPYIFTPTPASWFFG